jgi:hypothetical protein
MENVYTVAKPFFWLSRALGLFPMFFEGPLAKGKLKLKWYGLLASLLALLNPLGIIITILYFGEGPGTSSPWLAKAWIVQLTISGILNFFQVLIQIRNFRSVQLFLASLHAFDLKVRKI